MSKFNHELEDPMEACGLSREDFSERSKETIRNYAEDDSKPKVSHLTEDLFNQYTKMELAVMATQYFMKILHEAQKESVMGSLKELRDTLGK